LKITKKVEYINVSEKARKFSEKETAEFENEGFK